YPNLRPRVILSFLRKRTGEVRRETFFFTGSVWAIRATRQLARPMLRLNNTAEGLPAEVNDTKFREFVSSGTGIRVKKAGALCPSCALFTTSQNLIARTPFVAQPFRTTEVN